MKKDGTQDVAVASCGVEFIPASARRRHVACDLETISRLAAEFAQGEAEDPSAKGGRRPNQVVLWYTHQGATLVIDDLSRDDYVVCHLEDSEQCIQLDLLRWLSAEKLTMTRAEARHVLLSGLNSGQLKDCRDDALSFVTEATGLEEQSTSFDFSTPMMAQYEDEHYVCVSVRVFAGDSPRFSLRPMVGQMDQLRRHRAEWIKRTLLEGLEQHGAAEKVTLLHGRP